MLPTPHQATTTPIMQEEETRAPNNSSLGNGPNNSSLGNGRGEALPSSQPTDHSAAAQQGMGHSGLVNMALPPILADPFNPSQSPWSGPLGSR